MRLEEVARLDLNHLVVLAIILEEGGVSRAARRLGRTQSAVSHTLAELRRTLGDELLVRDGAGFVPTVYARDLQAELSGALALLGDLTHRPTFDPATAQRCFRVGWSDYLQLVVGARWLPALRRQAPGVDLETLAAPVGGPGPLLADGRLDLAFDVGIAEIGALRGRLLFEDELVCLVGSSVPLPGGLTLDAFLAAPHLLVAPQGGPGGPVDRALAAQGLRRRVALRLSHFMGVVEQVRNSDLITTLPRRLLLALCAPPERLLPPPIPLPTLRVRVVWHPRVQGDPGVVWLRQSLAKAMAPTQPVAAR
jgi:DNA-binding transcriptional LysR family regulator